MTTNIGPARLVPPGRILRRELEARDWTQKDLAAIMGRPEQAISAIIRGSKQITPDTAIELSKALGTSPDLWMNLESNYRLRVAERKAHEREIERRRRLYELLPIAEVARRGWIHLAKSVEELELEVCSFLGISDPDKAPRLDVNFRGTEGVNAHSPSCLTWLKRIEHLARRQTVEKFDCDLLATNGIPQLLEYAEEVESVSAVRRLLAKYGVRFIIVRHLPHTYLDGATFRLDSNPIVALSLRYDRIDAFWFTLMHELAHIVARHEGGFLDNLDAETASLEEGEANGMARERLIPLPQLRDFVEAHEPNFSKVEIKKFAHAIRRHPGIVLGRLQWENFVPYSNLRALLEKVSPYLQGEIDK